MYEETASPIAEIVPAPRTSVTGLRKAYGDIEAVAGIESHDNEEVAKMVKRMMVSLAGLAAAVTLPIVPFAAAGTAPTSATIASSTAVDFRATVTATKASGGEAPAATVTVAAFEKTGGTWRPLGRVRVGRSSGFFWKVLTGPGAIRQFSIGTSSPERVSVRLLVTPALGWSPVYHFHVQDGRLVAGS